MQDDTRRYAPSAARNRDAIAAVLRDCLPVQAASTLAADRHAPVLEIGSGTGEHVIHFAACFPHLTWQPTEAGGDMLASIEGWRRHAGLTNVLAPCALDVNDSPWPIQKACAVIAINVIHYSPAHTTEALLDGAARILPVGGVLVLYGPYRRHGEHTAPSNVQFDAWLKARDPSFGVPDLETVRALAQTRGLHLTREVPMPANNLSVVLTRVAPE